MFTVAINIFAWNDEWLLRKNQCLTAKPCHRKASGILSKRFQHISGTTFILICNKKLIPLSALDLLESDLGTSFLALLPGITGKGKADASSYRFFIYFFFFFIRVLKFTAVPAFQKKSCYLLGMYVQLS